MSKRLRELADVHYGKSPNEVLTDDSPVPIIGTGGVYGRASRAMYNGPAVVVPRKGSLGNPQYIGEPFWPVDTTYAVIPKSGVDAKWLYYSLAAFDLTKLNEATGVPCISRDWLYRILLGSDKFETQRRIAEILSTVDEAIEQAEALIAKYQQIKTGLMHNLFTRGVDAHSHLRPSCAQAAHFYKESPLGWIPKEWETFIFGNTFERVLDFRGRTPLKLGMDWGGEIPALSAMNVKMGKIALALETNFGNEALYLKWMTNGGLRKGDVVLTMEAPLGNVAQIPDDQKYILSQRVIALRFNSQIATNDFMAWLLRTSQFQREMVKQSSGTTATGIQRAKLVRIATALPKPDEQDRISSLMNGIQASIDSCENDLAKQKMEKYGLMHDLLTGRVRVKLPEE